MICKFIQSKRDKINFVLSTFQTIVTTSKKFTFIVKKKESYLKK